MKFKKIFALCLSLCLSLGICSSALATELAHSPVGTYTSTQLVNGEYTIVETPVVLTLSGAPETVDVNGSARLMLPYTFENVFVSTSSLTGVTVDIELSVVENVDNYSGFEIVGVRVPEVVGFTGYYAVKDSVSIVSYTYADARQTVHLILQFETKSSAGDTVWDTVTADTTLSFLD